MQVDPERLKRFLSEVARERSPWSNPQALEQIALFIEQTFSGFGYLVERDSFRCEGKTFWNLIAGKGSNPGPVFIVGAHFDAVEGSPGADDNASGVAVLLELARLLKDHPASEKIRFVAFNLEEWGMIGSAHYVASLRKAGVAILGMVSLEMLGFTAKKQSYPLGLSPFYPNRGDFIGIGANLRSRSLLKRFVQGMRRVPDLPVETVTLPGNGGWVPAIRLSDHAPFWDAGHPALLVTDTAFYRNPHYHSGSDMVETLDFKFLACVAQGVLEGVLEVVQCRSDSHPR